MKLKDFITITLLGVISFVISMVGGSAAQLFGAYGVFVHVSVGSLLAAPIYYVMCDRVAKRGTILLYYTIMGLVYAIMGFLPMLFIMVVAGLLGELIMFDVNNYTKDKPITISYVLSQVVYALHGFIFIVVLGTQGLADTFPNLFTLEKAQMIKSIFFNPKNMTIILLVQLVASLIGVLIGKQINDKFFKRTENKDTILK